MCRESRCRSPQRGCRNPFRFQIFPKCLDALSFESLNEIRNPQSAIASYEELQFLSRDSGWRTGHTLLATQPKKAGEATAGARRQADDDPADRISPATFGPGEEVLDYHQCGFAARDREATSEAAKGANPGGAGWTKHGACHRAGRVFVVARESPRHPWTVSLRPRHWRRETLSRNAGAWD